MSDHAVEGKVVAATRALALLNEQADGLRAELAKLRQNLAEVQRDFDETRTAQLREANEQLVLAALHADTIAETAVSNLVELTRASQRDALTDTPNRALMLDRLEIAITSARRRRAHIAVLFLDIDHFKQINDSLGHAVGDEVLQLVARRLESVVRDSDTVSRHSGDEFLVLLAEISQASDAALIAAKMLSALAEPSHVGNHVLCLSASIGIAIYPQDGEDAPTLIRRADAAMYRSKNQALGRFEFYSGERMSDAGLGLTASDVTQQPVISHELALAEHESRARDLREANEQLVITALTAQELEAQAEAAHHRQITFQAMVAHELRNPLTPIRMAAELLNDRADGPTLAKLQVIIRRQVTHMAKLIDDLLDGSRSSAGKFRLECRPIEMADIFDQAVETCRPAMELRLQRFTMQLPSGPLGVYGDPVRLSQVFSNLLSNASKYTPHGGEIALAVKLLDHAMAITVSDDGIGISAAALPKIFDLFIQDPRALALYNGGLGIGLAVVRELVEAHGGTVVGKSAGKDLGSEFIVTLPMPDMNKQ